jgi:hypothetical protein
MHDHSSLSVITEHLKKRLTDFLPYVLSLTLATLSLAASAEEAIPGRVGGGIGTIIVNQGLEELKRQVAEGEIISQQAVSASAVTQAIPVTQTSDVIGIYNLVSCFVQFTDGSQFNCNSVTFTGDMAITPNSTVWQRLAPSGLQTIVVSGLFSISNNIATVVNDLVAETSVVNLTWDPPTLTTVTTTLDFTETDVWTRTVAPAVPCPTPLDADGDGVIDDLDNCPGTPPGSFVDNVGCPGSGSPAAKVVVVPLCN